MFSAVMSQLVCKKLLPLQHRERIGKLRERKVNQGFKADNGTASNSVRSNAKNAHFWECFLRSPNYRHGTALEIIWAVYK